MPERNVFPVKLFNQFNNVLLGKLYSKRSTEIILLIDTFNQLLRFINATGINMEYQIGILEREYSNGNIPLIV